MRRRKHAAHVNHERWLVSYADFITLLFAFFVVLYASSQVDRRKVAMLSVSIESAFHELGAFSPPNRGSHIPMPEHETVPPDLTTAPAKVMAPTPPGSGTMPPEEMEKLKAELEKSLAAEISRQEVSIHTGPEGLVLSLREIGFFDSGSAQLQLGAQAAFDRIAGVLGERRYRLRIEGHTDNVPIHNGRYASNWELSTARATEVIRLLITQHGFPATDLAAAGYGEFHPVSGNDTLEGRRTNRRVDVVVINTINEPKGLHGQ